MFREKLKEDLASIYTAFTIVEWGGELGSGSELYIDYNRDINVSVTDGYKIIFSGTATIFYALDVNYLGVGYLSAELHRKLIEKPLFSIKSEASTERVQFREMGRLVVSKEITFQYQLDYNEQREYVTAITLEEKPK